MRKRHLLIALIFFLLAGHGMARAEPPLSLTAIQPEGETASLTQVVVRFSEDMCALGQMEQDTATSPLTLTMAEGILPAGAFRWLDTATLAWLFDEPVDIPVRITAGVKAGTTALSGNTLAEDVSWQISTPALDLSLSGNTALPPANAAVTLYSNYALDLDSLKNHTVLTMDGRELPVDITEIPCQACLNRPGRQNRWQYTILVKTSLPPDSQLRLGIGPGVVTAKGAVPLPARSFTLSAYESLRIKAWDIACSGKDKAAAPEAPVTIRFNNPVTLSDLLTYLELSPQAARIDNDGEKDHASTIHTLPFAWNARTRYTLTLKPDLEDSYDTPLGKEETFSFTTGDFSPMIHLEEGHNVMERPLKGLLPLDIRNITPVDIRVRHLPWGEATLQAWHQNDRNKDRLAALPALAENTLHLDFSSRRNQNIRHNLNIPEILGYPGPDAMPPGLTEIFVTWQDPDNLDRDGNPVKYTRYLTAQITNIGITARLGVHEGLVWITDITTGKPLPGIPVTLIDTSGKPCWQGTTGEKGILVLPGQQSFSRSVRYLTAQQGSDTSVLDIDSHFGSSDASNNFDSVAQGHYWKMHAITPLPLYQPGQTVHYTLYVKAVSVKDGGKTRNPPDWRPVAGEKVKVVIRDGRNRDVHTQESTTNAYGSVSGSFALSPEAASGHYHFYLTRPDNGHTTGSSGFQVAVFRAPDFKVDIEKFADVPNPPKRALPIAIGMKAAYFSGTSLPGAAATMTVTRQDEPFTPKRLAGYKTGITPDNPWIPHYRGWGRYPMKPPQTVAEIRETTDAHGMARFMLPDIAAPSGQPVRVGMEVTVTDPSGLTSQGTGSFLLHPSTYYVGIRAQRIIPKGEKQAIGLKAATWDNNPLSGIAVTLKAERIRPGQQNPDTPQIDPVWEKPLTLSSAEGMTVPVHFDQSGTWRLTAIVTDETGRENRSVATVFVPGPERDRASPHTGNQLEIIAEDIEYSPGETAKILVRNPYHDPEKGEEDTTGHLALVSIERDSVRSHFFTEISGAVSPIEIPIAKSDAPYLYASIVMVRPRTAAPPDTGGSSRDMGAPSVRHGTLLIRIKKDEPELAVSIATARKTYRPGETVDARVRVTDTANRPRRAQVTLLAVDNRILRAAGEKTAYDPAATFTPVHVYGIDSGDTRVALLNMDRIAAYLGGMAQQKLMMPRSAHAMPAESRAMEDTASAGSGNTEPAMRKNFSPLAHWLAAGETDPSGRLTTRFRLPDTLTGYRIVAIAADRTKDHAVAETEITATQPLQLLSAMPRFATEGDRLNARILVQNTGKRQQTVTVTAKASNMTLDAATRKITLGAGQSGTVTFPAKIGTPGAATLAVHGKAGRETDAATFTFPVMPATPLTTVAAAGLLKEGETRTLPVKPPREPDPRSRLDIIFSASPAAGLPMTAKQLIAYPWDCLEQRMSRAWARAIRMEHGELAGLSPDSTDRQAIHDTLMSAEKFQKHDGGFALWPGLSRSSLYLTTYVLMVNSQTSALGLSLPEDVERRAVRYLRERLMETRAEGKETHSRPQPETEAMALWLLTRYDKGMAQKFYPRIMERAESSPNTNPMTWAALLMAGNALPDMPRLAEYTGSIIRTLEKTAQATPVHLHFAARNESALWVTMGSTLRDNGMLLGALTRIRPDYPRLEALAAWTSQGLGSRPALSTQEAIYGLWGLTGYLKTLGGNRPVSLTATWNGRDTMTKRFTRLIDPPHTWTLAADRLKGGSLSGLTFTANEGNPYWSARLAYASPLVPVKDENAGITIRRAWTKPGEKAGLAAWKTGDIIDVTVTMTVPATRQHVLLFDPFPAGLEPLYATRVDLENANRRYQAPWQWEETRNDGMLLYSETVPPGTYAYTYRLRAAAPGTFVQRPTLAEEMYTPEVFGRTAGGSVTVKE